MVVYLFLNIFKKSKIMARWAVIKSNYVIDIIIWDGVTNWQYPGDHDLLI
jgi:hypothetical protein